MSSRGNRLVRVFGVLAALAALAAVSPADAWAGVEDAFEQIGTRKGVCAVISSPGLEGAPQLVVELAKGSELMVYFQTADPVEAAAMRQAAESAGLLGRRVFVPVPGGDPAHIQLADNVADAVLVAPGAKVGRAEALRVVHPGGVAILGDDSVVKPAPEGIDSWSHPYHGPDNNPQSTDQLARGPYRTQFLATPAFGCQPVVTVTAAGRVFKAYGHMAFREYQNGAINTLFAISGYNGAILWTRALKEGFMIHRNTMVATPELLYLADDESCKLLDAGSGQVKGQIVVPAQISDGPVWKWMAIEDGVLYALVGGAEVPAPVQRGTAPLVGGWPWGMWPGYDYRDPKTAWGHGRTLLAVDLKTQKVLWNHREQEYIDSRGTCMRDGRIYYYAPGKFLACLDAKTGQPAWKADDAALLAAIGPHGRAQTYTQGFATQTYVKCTDRQVLFAGPQRPNVVAVAAADGKLLWQKPDGNFQLVLREDAIYAAGRQGATSYKWDYRSGKELGRYISRRACTRATGSVDSIFYRAGEGTIRLVLETSGAVLTEHLSPMRPPCHDGVIVSDGLLYWGPWICGCRLSLFGHVCLGPASGAASGPGDRPARGAPDPDEQRLQAGPGDAKTVAAFAAQPGDWPAYRNTQQLAPATRVAVPDQVRRLWLRKADAAGGRPTAPTLVNGVVFLGGQDGLVRALDAADGWVYAHEAATGRLLWRFQAAPAQRWIPVYGKLHSTWPVAGGVVLRDGVVYAAAGIADYDGTHVWALDATTGKVVWHNDSSGSLSESRNGVSLQGNLFLEGDKLCFAGGNVYPTAQFDAGTGKCQNRPAGIASTARTLFYLPGFDPILRAEFPGGGGASFALRNSQLSYYSERMPGPGGRVRPEDQPSPAWNTRLFASYDAFVRAGDKLLAAGKVVTDRPNAAPQFALAALDVADGKVAWRVELPAAARDWGIAVDGAGRIVVSLADGRVVALGPP